MLCVYPGRPTIAANIIKKGIELKNSHDAWLALTCIVFLLPLMQNIYTFFMRKKITFSINLTC